jgi:hypothetical protein
MPQTNQVNMIGEYKMMELSSHLSLASDPQARSQGK